MKAQSVIKLLLLVYLFIGKGYSQELIVKGDLEVVAISKVPEGNGVEKYFHYEIFGPVLITTANHINAGKLNIEIYEMETWFDKPGKRSFSIFCNGELIDPLFDIFVFAGGKGIPSIKKFSIEHPGGPFEIKLEAIENNAKFHTIRVLDHQNKLISEAIAGQCKTVVTNEDGFEFRVLKPTELKFYNADHSPIGAYSTLVYGKQHSGGLMMESGRVTKRGVEVAEKGIIIAYSNGNSSKIMPFYKPLNENIRKYDWISDSSISRTLNACTDHWVIAEDVSWTHYSPIWKLADFENASIEEQKLFTLPVTIIRFRIDNSKGKSVKKIVFSLQEDRSETYQSGIFKGYSFENKHYLVSSQGGLLSSEMVEKEYKIKGANSAFEFIANPGQIAEPVIYVTHYREGVCAPEINGKYYYTSLFENVENVLEFANIHLKDIIDQSNQIDNMVYSQISDPYRQFLTGHSMHSYRFSTFLLNAGKKLIWGVTEGQYGYINTFDLVIDQLFYELEIHPWTIRNVLDLYASNYFYYDSIKSNENKVYPGGISFCHDMGMGVTFMPHGKSWYEFKKSPQHFMTQEELQNWIICAAGYYSKTRDHEWLLNNKKTITECLKSMLNRDHPDSTLRDGITDFITTMGDDEITTYDALDEALKQTRQNLYIAVKSWATYLMLNLMFKQLDMPIEAAMAYRSAQLTAYQVSKNFDHNSKSFPAIFDGQNQSKIIPAIEGLVYPYRVGMINETSVNGPFSDFIGLLTEHINSVLKPGICIDQESYGWKLSQTSYNTWQSKVYLCQFVTENILNVDYDIKKTDAVHSSFQVLGAGKVAWSDQLNSRNGKAIGSKHYPRGVTSALWWTK